ncbi:hypothetical protein M9978_14305 [Sphingomonas sp. MG17]|uniref:Ferrochelatase n=1 Tax=Sphingomonas tagetis TaxID=2949092 RepID=A0A9X2HI34_9SPHN|nr:hypothetical protein [Sphingomonas tagetis]MCP3731596.1 hypothetical protein [Sphingomonas tagetis]
MKKTIIAAASAALMLAGIGAAQANSAQSLSLSGSPARAATAADESNELRGGFIIPAIAVIAIILGILAATSGDSHPDSP